MSVAVSLARVHGFEMFLHPPDRDCVTPSMANGTYESFELGIICQWIRPGDTVVDVGAHVGYYTMAMAREVGPRGRVYAFEPDPVNFAILEENLKRNSLRDRVITFQKAVMDEESSWELNKGHFNTGDNRLFRKGTGNFSTVSSVRLDDVVPAGTAVNFIKYDTQGREPFVIRGAQRVLTEQSKLAMAVEYWPFGMREGGTTPEELLSLLKGFSLYWVDEHSKSLTLMRPAQVLSMIDNATDHFGNLFCVKGGR